MEQVLNVGLTIEPQSVVAGKLEIQRRAVRTIMEQAVVQIRRALEDPAFARQVVETSR